MSRRKISYFRRHSGLGHSIERLFGAVREGLSDEYDVSTHSVPYPAGRTLKTVLNGLWARARQGDINHIEGAEYYLAPFLDGSRTVITVHDTGHLDRDILTGTGRFIYRLIWFQIPCWQAARVVTISETTKHRLLQHVRVSSRKIRVIPNCYSPEYSRDPRPFNTSKPRVLHVGTGSHKNLKAVAEALQNLQCELRVIGELSDGQTEALRANDVDYSNAVDISDEAMLREYERCDIVSFPSLYEGFGMPILEGQAVGRPVITSDIPPMNEVAGEGAALVDPHEPGSIRRAMRRVMQDTSYRSGLVKKGFENVKQYSAKRVARMYEDLYREMIAENRRAESIKGNSVRERGQ